MARRLVLVLLAAGLIASGGAASAADATVAARGDLTFSVKIPGSGVSSCTALSTVQFRLTGAMFILNEQVLAGPRAGTPPVCITGAFSGYSNVIPGVRECTPAGGPVVPGSTLTVSGSTYTIRTAYTTCSGKNATDTIVMTAGTTSVTYKHDIFDFDGTEVHITGTLARDL
jgi:hypothetical protein